jgi:hypothetical protein
MSSVLPAFCLWLSEALRHLSEFLPVISFWLILRQPESHKCLRVQQAAAHTGTFSSCTMVHTRPFYFPPSRLPRSVAVMSHYLLQDLVELSTHIQGYIANCRAVHRADDSVIDTQPNMQSLISTTNHTHADFHFLV